MTETRFTFDGAPVIAKRGQSIAAALTDAGYRSFRTTAKGEDRGIFCGMGVCQDCLVTIDGAPNKRACVTKATAGIEVKKQVAFPTLDPKARLPERAEPRKIEPDVLIIGGGAGGLSAAIAARAAGAHVIVLDERGVSGGQYYKQSANGAVLDAQQAEGAALFADAKASGAEIIAGVEIWGAFNGPLFLADMDGTALIARPKTVIVATGAYERPALVPGWTLPGVMTTGAAQTLWRSYRTLPGKRVVVCGSGPLNLQVALELAKGGADVRLVAEAAPSPLLNPLCAMGLALAGPRLTLNGLLMIGGLRKHQASIRYATRLERIEQAADALKARFTDVKGEASEIETDVVCMNTGFEPQNEILRLLGTEMAYDPAFSQLRCVRTETLETSVKGVFAVGDCAGLGGAPAAKTEGHIAGRAAAAQTGFGDAYDLFAEHRQLRRHRRFQRNLWQLHDVSASSIERAPWDTILCRCEEVRLGDVLDVWDDNPGHLGSLKLSTRIGMGRCQGRYCAPAAARLIAERSGTPLTDRSFFAPRVPIKPVSIAAILAAQEALDGEI
ncbi:MAG: thioredoxin reductase [Dinoroseobacter sp.]|jgi:thioredoxin reductase